MWKYLSKINKQPDRGSISIDFIATRMHNTLAEEFHHLLCFSGERERDGEALLEAIVSKAEDENIQIN